MARDAKLLNLLKRLIRKTRLGTFSFYAVVFLAAFTVVLSTLLTSCIFWLPSLISSCSSSRYIPKEIANRPVNELVKIKGQPVIVFIDGIPTQCFRMESLSRDVYVIPGIHKIVWHTNFNNKVWVNEGDRVDGRMVVKAGCTIVKREDKFICSVNLGHAGRTYTVDEVKNEAEGCREERRELTLVERRSRSPDIGTLISCQ